jgi:hypothetical protein
MIRVCKKKEGRKGGREGGRKEGIWACGMDQVVEHLPSKHEALSSNSSTKKEVGIIKYCI